MAVDLARVKAHLSIDWDLSVDQAAMLGGLLAGAIAAVETAAQVKLSVGAVTQRFDGFVDRWGSSTLRLDAKPVVSVQGIDYLDGDGVAAELAEVDGDFRVVLGEPALLVPPTGGSWPSVLDGPAAITVRYTAGYADTPGDLDVAVLMLVAHWYHNREAVVTGTIATELPLGVNAICRTYRHTLIG